MCALCADDDVAAAIAGRAGAGTGIVTYGFADGADYLMSAYEGGRSGTQFALSRRGEPLGVVELPVPGRHNAVNAAGAAAIALELGVPFDAVTRALGGFGGVARRFQFRGERDGVTYVDDYAHLPSDVDAMIRAAREGGWERVVAVFQPHRYTRTAALWRDFADAFAGADALVLTDVYPAGEQPQPGVSGRLRPPRRARRPPGAGGHLPARAGPTSSRTSRVSPGPATSSSPWGPATSPRHPTSGWRRPRDPRPRAGAGRAAGRGRGAGRAGRPGRRPHDLLRGWSGRGAGPGRVRRRRSRRWPA